MTHDIGTEHLVNAYFWTVSCPGKVKATFSSGGGGAWWKEQHYLALVAKEDYLYGSFVVPCAHRSWSELVGDRPIDQGNFDVATHLEIEPR